MSEDTAVMETATSPWPDNMDTATQLVIQSPCTVPDVYQLICDRRNIRKVRVSGHEYTSQEIRCTSFTERLGGGGGPPVIPEDIPVPVPGEPLAVREGQIRPYARAMELLRREHPQYGAMAYGQTAEAPIQGFQAGTIHWEEISPGLGHTSDPIP